MFRFAMSANPSELVNPETIDYESNIKNILKDSETHLSITDIRIELTYRSDNLIKPSPEYNRNDIESDIEQTIEKDIEQDHKNGDIDLSREWVLYNKTNLPAEIEDTEVRYKII